MKHPTQHRADLAVLQLLRKALLCLQQLPLVDLPLLGCLQRNYQRSGCLAACLTGCLSAWLPVCLAGGLTFWLPGLPLLRSGPKLVLVGSLFRRRLLCLLLLRLVLLCLCLRPDLALLLPLTRLLLRALLVLSCLAWWRLSSISELALPDSGFIRINCSDVDI